MALFGLGKKTEGEEKKSSCCGTGCDCAAPETPAGECCGEKVDGICCIKVLGAGCKSCHEQYENAKKAAENLGLSIEVEYITDMPKVIGYGVTAMPAIVVNEKVVSQGKVLKTADVEKLLK
ncbi:MAG: TM0996/MTH895 family glutaredoxin-like protein [Oscillospiraceae bacterium]|nr:TM0996/MTH895 family glutaredoxin-like protein [Oscillospiraceae bacterium]